MIQLIDSCKQYASDVDLLLYVWCANRVQYSFDGRLLPRTRALAHLHRPNAEDLITACSRLCLPPTKEAKEKLISAVHNIFDSSNNLPAATKAHLLNDRHLDPCTRHQSSSDHLDWDSMMSISFKRSHFFPSSIDCDFPRDKMSYTRNSTRPKNYDNFSRTR